MKKLVVIYSGGMDSFTLLNEVIEKTRGEYFVEAISFDYGQRHLKELEYASNFCASIGVPHKIVDMSLIGSQLLGGSSQTDMSIEVPHGHYADENMKQTVVPNRNMIMIAIAVGYAVSIKAEAVYLGVHAGDHTIYPDCRPEFILDMQMAVLHGNYAQVAVRAPYMRLNKTDIARIGLGLYLDYDLSWTCYDPIGENVQWRPNTKKVSVEWMVGFFEGDGSVTTKKNKDRDTGKIREYPGFSFSQNEPSALYLLKEFFGFGSVSKSRNSENLEIWSYSTSGGNTCRKFAMLIEPLLKSEKRITQVSKWIQKFNLLDLRDAKPCGKCGSCVEREEALTEAGLEVPYPPTVDLL